MRSYRIALGPVPVDAITKQGALDAVEDLVRIGRGGYVVTPNVDQMVLAHRDPELRQIFERSSLSFADGQPLLWMARLLGTPLPAKVSGSDMITPIAALAAARGWRVFLFGATEAVSDKASRRLAALFPTLRIVGRNTSHWSREDVGAPDQSAVVRAIRASRADLVIVALGCPKQEFWMDRHADAIAPAVALGLGGSLDFVAGTVQRAPAWLSRVGLEWTYRLAQEPRRLAYRYLVRDLQIVPIFLAALCRALLARRRHPVSVDA